MHLKKFEYHVVSEILLSREEIEHLISMSKVHYDLTCQAASEVGGFIYGWKNKLWNDAEVSVCATTSTGERDLEEFCSIIIE